MYHMMCSELIYGRNISPRIVTCELTNQELSVDSYETTVGKLRSKRSAVVWLRSTAPFPVNVFVFTRSEGSPLVEINNRLD